VTALELDLDVREALLSPVVEPDQAVESGDAIDRHQDAQHDDHDDHDGHGIKNSRLATASPQALRAPGFCA
jgi:hypothetical protein